MTLYRKGGIIITKTMTIFVLAAIMATIAAAPGRAMELNLVPNSEWLPFEQWESGDKDYETNKVLNMMLNLGILADWYLTDKGIQEKMWDRGYKETNPFLGSTPNREQLFIYSLASILGNAILPKIIGNKFTDIFRAQQLKRQFDVIIAWSIANKGPEYIGELDEFNRKNPWRLEIPFKF